MRLPLWKTFRTPFVRLVNGQLETFDGPEVAAAPSDKTLLAIHAERLVNDPVLLMAFEAVERDLTANWRNSPLGQQDQREAAYRQIWALSAVKAHLQALLADKKMLEYEQKQKEMRDERERERRAA